MQQLETVLSPIVWLMELLLNFYDLLFLSTGTSILLLSFTFALLLLPLQLMAHRIEQRISKKIKNVETEVQSLKGKIKGEKLFLETEKIYERNGYHPIQSVGMGATFFVMLPVLISAIIIFTGSDILTGKSFFIIDDLSNPDGLLIPVNALLLIKSFFLIDDFSNLEGLLEPVNILPIIMFVITLIDAKLRFRDDKKSQHRFLLISFILLIIVYNLPAGLILYWIGNNIVSLVLNRIQSSS